MKTIKTMRLLVFSASVLLLTMTAVAQEKAKAAADVAPSDVTTVVAPLTADVPVLGEEKPASAPVKAATNSKVEKTEEDSDEMFIGLSVDDELGIEDEATEGSDRINISVEDETLENVVQMFTKMAGVNIIAVSSNLTDTVTVNLVDVEWKPALTAILAMHNLALLEKTPGSAVYMITHQQEGAPEPLVVETIFLDFTTVPEVAPVVEKMIAANGSVSLFQERNALVIRTTESNLGEIKQLIKSIDIASKQVSIEAKFMELNDSASKQLGLKWGSLAEFKMRLDAGPFTSAKGTEHTTSSDKNSQDYLRQEDRNQSFLLKDANGLPMSVHNPLITSANTGGNKLTVVGEKTVEGNPSFFPTLGSGTKDATSGTAENNYTDQDVMTMGSVADIAPSQVRTLTDLNGKTASRSIQDLFVETIAETSSTVLDFDTLELVLSALKTTDGVSIVSNPKMIVANGTTNAFFRVGNRWPIVRTMITAGTADSPGDAVDARLDLDIDTDYIQGGYLRTGIELMVVPVVKSGDLIQAEITPTLTSKVGDKIVAGNSWPELQVKEIKTRFTLASGQTVAIGGLTTSYDNKVVNKVPLLGDIPLIGKYLFTHTKEQKDQIETIIFVTLTLASPESLLDTTGMPTDTKLSHIRLLKDQAEKEKFMSDVERMKESAETEKERMAESVKKRLLKRKK